jgi:aryl-alcohol dehydrogenase-like predicted oxidoreductase
MEKRLLGKTDMRVSVVGFGSYKMSGKPGGSTIKEVERLIGSVLDAGVNVIDTAECYGESEELLGRAIGRHRGNMYLFTKCGHAAGLDLPAPAEFEAIRGRWKRVTWWRHYLPKRQIGWHGWV